MPTNQKQHIFIADDDPCICESVSVTLKHSGFDCTTFTDSTECYNAIVPACCDLLITDVKMPKIDGIKLLKYAQKTVPWMPVLVMTSYADIPMSVKAVKAGAFDFIEKPIAIPMLLKTVKIALQQNAIDDFLKGKKITKTENIVLRLVLQGRSSRQIAQILHRSIRTVEDHRNHIMRKLNVDNIVDLVKRATSMGFLEESD